MQSIRHAHHTHQTDVSSTSYSTVFDWHHCSKMSLTVAARALSTGSVNMNIGWPPPPLAGVFGVPGLPGVLHTENALRRGWKGVGQMHRKHTHTWITQLATQRVTRNMVNRSFLYDFLNCNSVYTLNAPKYGVCIYVCVSVFAPMSDNFEKHISMWSS